MPDFLTIAVDDEWFLGVYGAVTVTGEFIGYNGDVALDANGNSAPSFSGTIPATGNNPVNWSTVAGLTGTVAANYPTVRGVRATISSDVYVWPFTGTSYPADFKTNLTRARVIEALPQGNIFGSYTAEDAASQNDPSPGVINSFGVAAIQTVTTPTALTPGTVVRPSGTWVSNVGTNDAWLGLTSTPDQLFSLPAKSDRQLPFTGTLYVSPDTASASVVVWSAQYAY